MNMSVRKRCLWVGLIAAAGVIACVFSFQAVRGLGETVLAWDPSSHGLKGVAVAHDLKTFDLPGLYGDVIAQQHYPPIHSLLQAPFYLIFGYEPWAGVFPSLAALVFAVIVAALICFKLGDDRGVVSALMCVTLMLSSVPVLLFANVLMLEIFGGALLLWCVYCRVRMIHAGEFDAVQQEEYRRWSIRTAVGTTMLMLTSANFALIWIVNLLMYEFLSLTWDQKRRLWDTVRSYALSRRLWHPLNVLVMLILAFVGVIYLTGGFRFVLFGRKILLTSTGAPLYFVLIIILGRIFYTVWKRRVELRESVPVKYRVFFFAVVIPLFLWFFVLYPSRFKQFFDWLEGAPSSSPFFSANFLLFYPRAILRDFHATEVLGLLVPAFFVLSLIFVRRQSRAMRFVQFVAVMMFFFCFIHRGRDVRFILPFMFLFWVIASLEAVRILAWLPRVGRYAWPRWAMLAALLAAVVPQVGAVYQERFSQALGRFYIGGEIPRVFQYITDQTRSDRRMQILGDFDALSHHLFEWEQYRKGGPHEVRLDFNIENPNHEYPEDLAKARKIFDDWVEKNHYDVVAVILRGESSPYRDSRDYKKIRELWYIKFEEWMAEQKKYRLADAHMFEASGIEVRIYRPEQAGDH